MGNTALETTQDPALVSELWLRDTKADDELPQLSGCCCPDHLRMPRASGQYLVHFVVKLGRSVVPFFLFTCINVVAVLLFSVSSL